MERKTKIRIIETFLFAVGLLLMLLWLQGRLSGGRIEPKRVEGSSGIDIKGWEVKVVRTKVKSFEEVIGTVIPELRIDVSSRIMERILDIKVEEGNRVKKGDVLVLLDDRNVKSKIEQAKASLYSAKANRERAEINYNRYKRLYSQDAVTKYDLESMETNYKVAVAEEKRMEELVDEVESLIDHLIIRSPIDGYVISRMADPGDMCIPGKPLLTIEGGNVIKFRATVREGLSGIVKKGQKINVYIDALGKELTGDIKEIIYSMDQSSRDFTIKIRLPRVKGLLPGMYGKAFIPIGWKETILIPEKYIQHMGQIDFVYCKENGKTVIRYLKVGKRYGENVEILSGLNEGDILIAKE